MNRWMFLLLSALLFSACVSPLPLGEGLGVRATPTPTLTSTPTRTPTPTLTPTPTVTPTPSLPPEALTRLAGRDWRIEGDKVVVGDVAWYARDAEGQWQPADFIREFDKFGYPTQGLTFSLTENGIEAVDAEGRFTKEPGRVVYTKADGQEGLFYWEFAVRNLNHDILMPTKYPPRVGPFFIEETKVALYEYFIPTVYPKNLSEFERLYGIDAQDSRLWRETGAAPILVDPQKNSWVVIHNLRSFAIDYNLPTPFFLVYLTAKGDIVIVPLMGMGHSDYEALGESEFEQYQLYQQLQQK